MELKKVILLILVAVSTLGWAQKVSFSTSTEKKTYYDFEPIYLVYKVVNANYQGVEIPKMEDFDVVRNFVNSSSNRSIVIVNGKRVSNGEEKYEVTFELKPKKTGLLNIPKGVFKHKGKVYSSSAFKIEVKSLKVSGEEVAKERFIKVELSKSNPMVGESFTITYTLFTVDEIKDGGQIKSQGSFQNFGPFTAKEISKFSGSAASINGKRYTILQMQKHALTPVKAGSFTVPSFDFEYQSYVYHRQGWFNTTREATDHLVKAPSVKIIVKPLPKAPLGFNGLVGKFTLKSKVDKKELPVNDALTVKYELAGSGNFSSLKEMPMKWSNKWEVIESKRIDKTKAIGAKMTGKLVFEMVAIPRNNGELGVPGAELKYFDLGTKKYKTLSVAEKVVKVTGDASNEASFTTVGRTKSKVNELNQDIRYLSDEYELEERSHDGFNTVLPITIVGTTTLGSLVLLFFFRPKTDSENDKKRKKQKGAYKKANKMLMAAEKSLTGEGDFYFHLESALNGFLKDKYDIPQKELTKQVLGGKMKESGVGQEQVIKTITLYEKCGMAKYSPIGADQKGLYNEVKELLVSLM